MAWLAVNKHDLYYGYIFDEKPERVGEHWEVEESIFNNRETGIAISMDSVIRVVGRPMYWEDEPVEI